jgi:acetyl esterase/lipase
VRSFFLAIAFLLPVSAARLPNPLSPRSWGVPLPGAETPENVLVHQDLAYSDAADTAHKLDLYIPRNKSDFPIVVFIHGGDWRIGDRSQYRGLGNRLARAGVGVAIPNFRLMGIAANRHPAQVEDLAEAFAWVYAHAKDFGGDRGRIYLAGHSSGAHLASLLALNGKYLAKHDLALDQIEGVIAISGVYNVERLLTFHAEGPKKLASPIRYVHAGAPPFLVVYSQWDFLTLPQQARRFAAALKREKVPTEVLRIPGDNHVSEIWNITQEHGTLIDAVLRFVQ